MDGNTSNLINYSYSSFINRSPAQLTHSYDTQHSLHPLGFTANDCLVATKTPYAGVDNFVSARGLSGFCERSILILFRQFQNII